MDISRRLGRLTYAITAYAVIGTVFVLIGGIGVRSLPYGPELAVPLLIVAGGMVVGTAVLIIAAVRGRRTLVAPPDATTKTRAAARAVHAARWGRVLILLAGAGSVICALLLDPPVGDSDRSLGPAIAIVIGSAVAIFAAAADDVARAVRTPTRGGAETRSKMS